MAESRLSANQNYIKHMHVKNGSLSVKQYTIQVLAIRYLTQHINKINVEGRSFTLALLVFKMNQSYGNREVSN